MIRQTVTAYPVVQDVPALVQYLSDVFGAKELRRAVGSAGGYHVELQIGDTQVMLGGGGEGVSWKGDAAPLALHIYVPDVDTTYALALSKGGRSLQPPADQDWGERTANVVDPGGNLWYIATFKGENYFSEGAPAVQPFLQPLHSEPVIEFIVGAFSADELGRATDDKGAILHSTLKVGNSAIEIADAHDEYRPMTGMYYVVVESADESYERASAAGGNPHTPLIDQPYGDRTASVTDPVGNIWYIASPIAK